MGLFGNILRGIGAAGAVLGAPFTGGASLGVLGPILGAGAGVAGGILSNTRGARTGEQSSTSTRTPIIPENVQAYIDSILGANQERLNTPLDINDLALDEEKLLGGVDQLDITGRSRINRLAEAQRQNVSSNLASRGLSESPGVVSNAFATTEGFRGGALADLSNSVAQQRLALIKAIEERRANLPILFENLLNNRLSTAGNFLGQIPLGSTITSSGTNIVPGSAAAGGLQGGLQGFALGGGLDGLFDFGSTSGNGLSRNPYDSETGD